MEVEFRRCRGYAGGGSCPEDESCSLGIVLEKAEEAEKGGSENLRTCLYDLAHKTGINVSLTNKGAIATCSNDFFGAITVGILTLDI